MQEAMDRLQEEQNATTTSKPDILEYLAFSTYMQGIYHHENRFITIPDQQQLNWTTCTKEINQSNIRT